MRGVGAVGVDVEGCAKLEGDKEMTKRLCLVCGEKSKVLIDPNGICSLCNSVFTDWRLKKNWSPTK